MGFIIGRGRYATQTYPEPRSNEALAEIGALGNYASIVNATPAHTSAAPTTYIVAAVVMKPKMSGIFRVDVNMGWFDTTPAELVTWSLLAAEASAPATPITMTGGSPAAIVGSTVDASTLGEVSVGVGTPIALVNGGGPVTLASKFADSVAGADQQQNFDVNGIFSNAGQGTTKTPFTLGVDCVFYLEVTAPAGTIENMVLQFSVQEQPLP